MSAHIIKQKNDGILLDNEELIRHEEQNMPKQQCLTMIAAAAENNALGKNNDLIWHISDDLKRFKRLTSGHSIIMGRKTFESMPKALPNRTNIILTQRKDYRADQAVIVHSVSEALEQVKDDLHPFVIGGGEIYRLFMETCDRIELTRVHHNFDADVFFPDIDLRVWKEIACERVSASEGQPYDYSYITYIKK